MKLKNVINKHKSNKIKENSNTVRHLNIGTDHRHSKSCCDQSSPARRTIKRRCFVVTKICNFVQLLQHCPFTGNFLNIKSENSGSMQVKCTCHRRDAYFLSLNTEISMLAITQEAEFHLNYIVCFKTYTNGTLP